MPAGSAGSKFFYLIAHSWKMMVPAVIYLVMNILGFVALGHLDASTFSIVAQMKVFTTAIFSVLILGRDLHLRKWRALTTLTLGVILISNEAMPHKGARRLGNPSLTPACASCHRDGRVLRRRGALGLRVDLLRDGAQVEDRDLLRLGPQPAARLLVVLIYTPIMLYDNPPRPSVAGRSSPALRRRRSAACSSRSRSSTPTRS